MKTLIYSAHRYDTPSLAIAGKDHQLVFTDKKLSLETALMASGFDAVALFTSDDASAPVLERLHQQGIRHIALRSVGYDHVDLKKAETLGMSVANVPEYSPYAIAEHATAILLAMNRKIVEGQSLMKLLDFRLDTLTGFDIHGKIVGIIGTGKIGMAFASIMHGFGASILACDPVENPAAIAAGIKYASLEELLKNSDIISIHCPLNQGTHHLLSRPQFDNMKQNSILINTSRGGVINTADLIEALETEKIGGACLDVYEKEKGIFFEDHRKNILTDVQFAHLRNLKNVLITGHQAFLTREALTGIAQTTIKNLDYWQRSEQSPNELTLRRKDEGIKSQGVLSENLGIRSI